MTQQSDSGNPAAAEPHRPRFSSSPMFVFAPGARACIDASRADGPGGWPAGTINMHIGAELVGGHVFGDRLTIYGQRADLEVLFQDALDALRAVPDPQSEGGMGPAWPNDEPDLADVGVREPDETPKAGQ